MLNTSCSIKPLQLCNADLWILIKYFILTLVCQLKIWLSNSDVTFDTGAPRNGSKSLNSLLRSSVPMLVSDYQKHVINDVQSFVLSITTLAINLVNLFSGLRQNMNTCEFMAMHYIS